MDNAKVPSHLEINFNRLLDVTQKMANGDEPKGWLFSKKIKLLILYGTETGTAEEMAEAIYRTAIRKSMLPKILSMNDMTINELVDENLVLFVAATTGQGDDPENMKQFFQSLWKQRNNRTLLKNVQFGVIGLGDSSYQKFNYASKRLNNLLMYLGAKELLSIGLADDRHELGPNYVTDLWLNDFFTKLCTIYPDQVSSEEHIDLLPPKYKVKSYITNEKDMEMMSNTILYNKDNPYNGRLSLNEIKCSPDHFQDVRLIQFDISSMKSKYKPGDVLMVHPQNTDENVNKFISLLGLDGDKKIIVRPHNFQVKAPHWYTIPPSGCTIKECVKKYFDIQSIPKQYFFELLSFFTTDDMEKEKFLEFSSPSGKEELFNYCNRPKRTILEVLNDFPYTNKNIPLKYLFDLIPAIKPRAYSIASSYLANPDKVQILVALVQYKTNLKAERIGLCSNWLANLPIGSEAYIWIKSGSLKFPNVMSDASKSVIMIGPGTGCAPFRSFINENIVTGNNVGVIMIFGCRSRHKDFFFKDEWEHLEYENKIKLLCAFSRDQDYKIYIQHVIKNNSSDIWKYISNENTDIFYAGNAKRIPIDVYESLLFVCEKEGNMTSEEAKAYFKKNIEKRYQTESWA